MTTHCKNCGKILANQNQFHRCLMTITINDSEGNNLASIKTRKLNIDSLERARKLTEIPKVTKDFRVLSATIVIEKKPVEVN